MSAENDLRTLLEGTSAITSLVGVRIRAQRAEQLDPLPFITFARTDTVDLTDIGGQVLKSQAVLGVQCWAKTQTDADALAALVAAAVRAVPPHVVSGQTSAYEETNDICAAVLTVEWWE